MITRNVEATSFRAALGEHLDAAARGWRVVVTRHGRPIAELHQPQTEPLSPWDEALKDALDAAEVRSAIERIPAAALEVLLHALGVDAADLRAAAAMMLHAAADVVEPATVKVARRRD